MPLINFMAITESGPMFLKFIDGFGEIKDKYFIAKHMRDAIIEVEPKNVVQIITDNAVVCKTTGMIIELEFSSIYWTPCVVHTLSLARKNICSVKNTEKNSDTYQQCSWITQTIDDATFFKNFIVGHFVRLSMFNNYNSFKLLSVAPTRFVSTIVMVKGLRSLKKGLQEMVISDKWSSYKEDNVDSAQFVKETLLADDWWMKVLSKLCKQPIIVYIPEHEHRGGGFGSGFIPIAEYGSEFRKGSRRKAVRLLYSGKNHYDLLV